MSAATKLSGLAAAVGYYGGAIVRFADDKPKVPTQLHFGEKDAGIPLADVETIKAKRPDVDVFVYPGAQHGFHCDERASYDKTSADIAWPRSLEFFAKHLKEAHDDSPRVTCWRSQNQRSPTNTVSPGLIEVPSGTTIALRARSVRMGNRHAVALGAR